MNLYPLPKWSESNMILSDGTFFKRPFICSKQKPSTCQAYYNDISSKKGFFTCPAGLSSYSLGDSESTIFSGIRVEGVYDNKKLKNYKTDYLPTIPKSLVISSVSELKKKHGIEKNTHDINLMNSSFHEIRKLNTEIKRLSEELMLITDLTAKDYILKKAKTIFASSSLISLRLSIYDFEENPRIVTASNPYPSKIFSKFEKAAHVLEIYAKDNGVKINPFQGNSYKTLNTYPAFDFLPFVILENAIKYSPREQEVIIEFSEIGTSLEVKVSSIGPVMTKDEIKQVYNKGSRGKAAFSIDNGGGGYGMYFAKLICDLHSVKIAIDSGPKDFSLNGVDYSTFEVTLKF